MFLFSNCYLFALDIQHLITHITVKRNKQQHSLQVRRDWCESPRHQITGEENENKMLANTPLVPKQKVYTQTKRNTCVTDITIDRLVARAYLERYNSSHAVDSASSVTNRWRWSILGTWASQICDIESLILESVANKIRTGRLEQCFVMHSNITQD